MCLRINRVSLISSPAKNRRKHLGTGHYNHIRRPPLFSWKHSFPWPSIWGLLLPSLLRSSPLPDKMFRPWKVFVSDLEKEASWKSTRADTVCALELFVFLKGTAQNQSIAHLDAWQPNDSSTHAHLTNQNRRFTPVTLKTFLRVNAPQPKFCSLGKVSFINLAFQVITKLKIFVLIFGRVFNKDEQPIATATEMLSLTSWSWSRIRMALIR